MTAEVTLWSGEVVQLPELLAWDVSRTDGSLCDSFTVCVPMPFSQSARLAEATRLTLRSNGGTVFTGVVDEIQTQWSDDGFFAEIAGRGMGALLIDNEVTAARFEKATLSELLRRYAAPFGIRADAEEFPSLDGFSITTGDSCMQVLKGYCRHVGAQKPRFLADGTLYLRRFRTQSAPPIQEREVLEAQWGLCCCEVLSSVITVSGRGIQQETENAAFQAQCGRRRRVRSDSGGLSATSRTAQEMIEESEEERDTLILKLAGERAYEPGCGVWVELPTLGVRATYGIRQVRRRGSEKGITTQLTLYR